MAFLKFNKSELVNLSYSLKRETIGANTNGAYCNTSIVGCNTRRYHGLLGVPVDSLSGHRFILLSSLDESLILNGRQFNLGIHCYGDVYEPKGHKYIVDFQADPVPTITYKIGESIFTKTFILDQQKDRLLIKYELNSPASAKLILKPFLAFRGVHELTHKNPVANLEGTEVKNGMAWKMYESLPTLYLQTNSAKTKFNSNPNWYENITYTDEARRGFDCKEDLYVPGTFELPIASGQEVIVSASVEEENPSTILRSFKKNLESFPDVIDNHGSLVYWAQILKNDRVGHKRITSGLSWLYTGLLRETLLCLPGLTLYANGDTAEFEEILDNLIADEQERLFRRTTQIEAPLMLADVLQKYIDFGANPRAVWKKYGPTVKGVIESYAPGVRKEVTMQPNGLVWGQMDNVALTWMNAYVDGKPVTERPGYQVETNAYWFDMVCYAVESEKKYGSKKNNKFVETWEPIQHLIEQNFQPTFWNSQRRCLADYVDGFGQNQDIRPNQLFALSVHHCPVSDEVASSVMAVVEKELVTRRGIRTLSPRNPNYKNVYEGSQTERDLAYHQGSARPWLLGPYVQVGFEMMGSAFCNKAEWLVKGFYEDLNKHGIGAVSELYDGDPPHEPHGAIVSGVSIAALLYIDRLINIYKNKGVRK